MCLQGKFNNVFRCCVVIFGRTNLALSDISCVLLSFLSDISSSVGHILLFFCNFCRTYLALSDNLAFFCNFCRTHLALSDISCILLHFL